MDIVTDKNFSKQALDFQAGHYALKLYKNGKPILNANTRKLRRFLKILRSIKFEEGPLNIYLKVDYGRHLDVYNRYSDFYNDGSYDNEHDLWMAFSAFTEKG